MAALRKGLPMLGRVLVAGQKPLSSPTPSLGQKMGFFSTSSDWKSWAFRKDADKLAGHSTLLSSSNTMYEFLVEDVKPEFWEDYINLKGDIVAASRESPGNKAELIAAWTFILGDCNFRALHLFRYEDGYSDMDLTLKAATNSNNNGGSKLQELLRRQRQLLTRQETETLKGFSFWPEPDKRSGDNIYDVRSYKVKPGSMYDWSNYWAKGMVCRRSVRDNIPYAGFFSQLGELHIIYHIWCYSDLVDRKKCRESTWNQPSWDDVVAKTVPLVKTMKTRILKPLPYSPTK